MGVSTTPPSADDGNPAGVPVSVPSSPPSPPSVVAVAYSGGRDSTALLHATWRALLAPVEGGGAQPEVVALHVHHGLHPQADAWLVHCEAQCARWAAEAGRPLRFRSERLTGAPAPGDSVEAWARAQRYEALARMARAEGATLVLLAHHRRDQAETFLLQALRGAGMAGLSGMPAQYRDAQGLRWCRPWLERPREAIDAYVARHRLDHIEDDSNANPRFARNRLRLNLWPSWTASFPDAEASLAQAARRAQEAQACLAELAHIDLRTMAPRGGPLDLKAWSRLSPPRRGNALHAWLQRIPGLRVTRPLLDRLSLELGNGEGAPARWPCGDGELRRYQGELSYAPGIPESALRPGIPGALLIPAPGRYELPAWGGRLHVFPVEADGLAWTPGMVLTLRRREGAEQFQAGPRQPARSLKKQFQSARVPAWERTGPLVYQGEDLVFVPGLGLDARAWAPAGVAQVGLRWEGVV